MREVGVVLSRKPPTQAAFEFELREPGLVGAGDYVEVPCERGTIVARVLSIRAENDYFAEVGLVREHAEYGLRLPSGAAPPASWSAITRACGPTARMSTPPPWPASARSPATATSTWAPRRSAAIWTRKWRRCAGRSAGERTR